jgi:hypothetical protein
MYASDDDWKEFLLEVRELMSTVNASDMRIKN